MSDVVESAGVLCLHGFTGTPFEVQFLAESLHRGGFVVESPMLPGHGTTADELNRTTRGQWREAVAAEVDKLRLRCDWVAIAGQSMGGLLALDSAADGRPDAVVALATPLWLERGAQLLLRGLSRIPRALVRRIPHREKDDGSDVCDERVKAENPAYPVLPVAGLVELTELMNEVRAELARVRAPLLVIHGRNDHTAPVECADEILRSVSSGERSLSIMPRSYHLIACDVEREQVAARVLRFLTDCLDRHRD